MKPFIYSDSRTHRMARALQRYPEYKFTGAQLVAMSNIAVGEKLVIPPRDIRTIEGSRGCTYQLSQLTRHGLVKITTGEAPAVGLRGVRPTQLFYSKAANLLDVVSIRPSSELSMRVGQRPAHLAPSKAVIKPRSTPAKPGPYVPSVAQKKAYAKAAYSKKKVKQ